MPANQSLAVRDTCKLETAIREIDVSAGSVVLTRLDGDGRVETTVVEAQDGPKTFDPPQSGFDVFAPDGARFHVVYETDPVGTEEARDQGPKVRSQPRRKRSASRRTSATKAESKEPSAGKASGSGARKSSRGSKRASSNSGARKRNSTKSAAKKKG